LKKTKVIEIDKELICNLSRIPTAIYDNPCYKTAVEIMHSEERFNHKSTPLMMHYKNYNPKTLYHMYGVVEKLKNYECYHAFLPWIHYKPVDSLLDHAFINRDEKFIKNQVHKMQKLIKSIDAYGYRPEKFIDRKEGHITGYFIEDASHRKFYVVSGNHRAAILSAMHPDRKLPVILEKESFMKERDKRNRGDFRTLYKIEDAKSWPSVRSAFLTEDEARQIMNKYLET